ncbi:MAG: DUF5666 domain-containing protein [Dehalococcoidia bacterium]
MAGSFASILDECLDALNQGERLEDCLARYPGHAEDLRTHLLLARRLSLTPRQQPRAAVQDAGWRQFRERAEDIRLGHKPRPSLNIGWKRPLAIAAALVMAALVAGGGTVYAAQGVLPDSPLYRVKLASEDVRVWFTFDDASKAELLLDQSSERTDEIMELLYSGKPISGNVLASLRSRNARAVRILEDRPEERALLQRAHEQSAAQESLLLALWGDISESGRDDYAETVATLHNAQLRTDGVPGAVMPDDLAAGVINITGSAQEVVDGVWLFGGVEVRLDDSTLGDAKLQTGQAVNVVAARGANGRLLALSVVVTDRRDPRQQYVVSGAIDEVSDNEVVIAGQRIAITENTLLKLRLHRGQQVEIKVEVEEISGEAVASRVEGPVTDGEGAASPLLVYEGAIEDEISTGEITNEWVIGGQRFLVTPSTEIDARAGALVKDARARVEASIENDVMVARRVVVLAPDIPQDATEESGIEADGAETDGGDEVAISDESPISIEGIFEEGDEDSWTISGIEVDAPPDVETPEVGSLVTLEGRREGNALVTVRLLATFQPSRGGLSQVRGLIGKIEEDGTLQIGSARIDLGVETVVKGKPQVGSRVFIWGSRDETDALQALYINILDPEPLAPDSGLVD